MNIFLICLILIFFLYSFVKIFNKTYLLGLVYFLLFIYMFFTIIGYIFYPDKLSVVSNGQYYNNRVFIIYYSYIFLSFLLTFIFVNIIYKYVKIKINIKIKFKQSLQMKKINHFIFNIILFCYLLLLLYFFIKNYTNLSYYNQYILKSNKLWFFAFSFTGIILLTVIACYKFTPSRLRKCLLLLYLVLLGTTFLLISIKAGQRIQIFNIFMSLITIFLIKNKVKMKLTDISKLIKPSILIFIFIFISQLIRNTRGRIENLTNIKLTLDYLTSLANFDTIVFQDYLNPSLTLMTSINYNFIYPIEILKSNILNSMIVFDYPGAGERISRFLDPYGWGGVGYYYFTEGYNMMGFFGFLYSSILIVFTYYLYEKIFTKTNDEVFNVLISGVIAYYMIDIVRGGSLFLFKGILFYIIPFIILYCIATNKTVVFKIER